MLFNILNEIILLGKTKMNDIENLAIKAIELMPEIIRKKPELAFRMFEILKRHFVPIEIFQEYLNKLDNIDKKSRHTRRQSRPNRQKSR